MNDTPQHEHLKDEQDTKSVELFTALPPLMTLEDIWQSMAAEFPLHPTVEGILENLTPAGRSMKLRIVKLTIEFTDQITEAETDGD